MSLSSIADGAAASADSQTPVANTQRMAAVPSPALDKMDISPAPDATPLEPPQSQPMTATPSNSSEQPSFDHGDNSAAAPYGTRSRNRTGGMRPNYADDKDIDLEIEAAAKISKANKRASTTATPSVVQPETPAVSGSGFATLNTNAQPVNGVASNHAPGSGHYNVLPPPQPASKKRKQPGSNATVAAPAASHVRTKVSPTSQARSFVETNMLSFERCGGYLNSKKQLVADDGTVLEANDHAYFICEPPGEPYYLARIMEFLHANNDPSAPVDAVRVNWYYRPKDIQRRVQDTRVVFASMHSDTCPLTSLRGKNNIQHLAEIDNLDDYRLQKDYFWFDKLYDRYMHRYYEVIPTSKVVNVPPHVKKVLDEFWKFVLVEVGRGRDLTSESKKCRRCQEFAANNDSVDCAVCKCTYHMACVRPPLLKKPARGFAWACAACSRAQELMLQKRNTPTTDGAALDDEPVDDEDDELATANQGTRESSTGVDHPPPTAAQLAMANLWPYRYLGIHSKAEDALDYDDRIYPRASSRLGPRHQANVMVWHGRPVELVKPAEGKKKYKPVGGKKDAKGTTADTDKDKRQKRPKWVVDEPPGYVARGLDEPVEVRGKKEYTSQVIFKLPEPTGVSSRGLQDDEKPSDYEQIVDDYIRRVKPLAAQYDVLDVSTDFLTKAVEKLQDSGYNTEKALDAMKHLSRRNDLKQPDLNKEEQKRFEEGVAKFGSELHLVSRHVSNNIKEGRIVRHYYMWKKSEKGRQIWGNYEGRKSKKESRRVEKDGSAKLLDDVADDYDDSAFDNDKAVQKKRGFVCKFCDTRSSRQWRRAPQTAPGTLVPADAAAKTAKDKASWLTLALCGKCAYLWRRYAIQYESIEEISKKIAASGSRAAKRRIDEELMRTVIEAQSAAGDMITRNVAHIAHTNGVDVPPAMVQTDEPPKKKAKAEVNPHAATPEVVPEKKKPVEPEPLEPEPPRIKVHPCAVCHTLDIPHDKLMKCRDCRLHVHGTCYGVGKGPHPQTWFCDTCRNDHSTQVSTNYDCVLCSVKCTPQELMEPPRISHKKKSDREREKERLEREIVQEAGRRWRQDQEAAGRPVNPREALKRTAWNNWIHVVCAVWTKEIKFGNAELLDAAEGIGFVPPERYQQTCKFCKVIEKPIVNCQMPGCNESFHVGCAHQAEYIFGFDVAPVKGSRRDSVATLKLDQEYGLVTPAIWCSSHVGQIPTVVHAMNEMTSNNRTALQEYVIAYKQVDTSITGTVRRAAQFTYNSVAPAVQPLNRRTSTINGAAAPTAPAERTIGRTYNSSPSPLSPILANGEPVAAVELRERGTKPKKCCSCLVDASPKWWTINAPHKSDDVLMTNGIPEPHVNGTPGVNRTSINDLIKAEPSDVAPGHILLTQEGARYQCHKCHVEKKTPPSSPSQVRPREKPRPEPVQEPVIFQTPYAPPPSGPYAASRPSFEPSTHTHAPVNGVPPHHPAWSASAPTWAPPIRNGSHPPPPTQPQVYGTHPPPFRSGISHLGSDYGHPYGRPPPAPPYSSLHQPPIANGRPVNGVPSHPSTVSPYGQPPPMGAQPPRAQSPRSYGHSNDRPTIPSPQVGLSSSVLSRSFAPPDSTRQRPTDSPVGAYTPRQYQPPLPPPGSLPRQSSAQSLAQIAQAATEQTGQSSGPVHSRQQSVDALGTPRLGVRAGIGAPSQSPGQRPATPADAAQAHNQNQSQGPTMANDSRRSGGPGASASPSLRNLLS